MNYDFDILVDRRFTGNEKHDSLDERFIAEGAISYSGAELDVKTAPCIREALAKRAMDGIYGYTKADGRYMDSVVKWMKTFRDWDIDEEWIVPTYGTMQSICTAIRAFTEKGDGVIVQPPVYLLYYREIERTGRKIVYNPLVYNDGVYSMDFENLDTVMSEEKNKLMILCNPHNPIMDVWDRDTLEKVAELAGKHNIIVVSDEIFAEHTYCGPVTPYAEVGAEHCIVTTSLGKAFNFTGSSHANAVIPDERIRQAFIEQRNEDHYGSVDPFIYTALTAAYSDEGKKWIDALLEYSAENEKIIKAFFAEHFPRIKVCRHRAGTLLWIDLRSLGMKENELQNFLREEALFLADTGSIYGPGGECFIRMEIGTPRGILTKALDRLLKAAEKRNLVSK